LPLLEDDREENQHDSGITGTEHIMLIDDDPQLLKMGNRILLSLGYRVSLFRAPLAAIEAFRHKPADFDIVITDFKMSHLNGIELGRRILDERPDIPILLISGNIMEDEIIEATEMGIKGFLRKPFSKNEIASKLKKISRSDSKRISNF
jgi:DNA-binding NtrC family response regulator